jgi:hypothetical protein
LGGVVAVGRGAPDQLTVGFETKDVEGRDHRVCTMWLIPQLVKHGCSRLHSVGARHIRYGEICHGRPDGCTGMR